MTGLNLDEIIFFRRQEVQVYVDEDNKPEVGNGINKPAEVTLDAVYPNDKTTREKITGLYGCHLQILIAARSEINCSFTLLKKLKR